MNTPVLPLHIGGYQHLEPHVTSESSDILVRDGKPLFFSPYPGAPVGRIEQAYPDCRVYRKMACPRQGGDRALTEDEKANLAKLSAIFQKPDDLIPKGVALPVIEGGRVVGASDHQMSEPNVQPLIISPTYNGPARSEPVPTFHKIGSTGMPLPTDAKERKGIPIATGFVDYFPKTMAAVARLSQIGNEQHNPGAPLHWDRSKSGDEADAFMRHFLQRDEIDSDGVPHVVKCAWRANAMAQKYLEKHPWP